VIIIMIVCAPLFLSLSQKIIALRHELANSYCTIRSNRQRLCTLQIRRLRPKSLRRPQLALVRRAPHLLRALPRHRLPRSVLPAQQRRRVRAGRLLQFHTSEGAECGVGSGVGTRDEEVVEGEGEG